MDIQKYALAVDELRWQCNPDIFDFDCTKDLAPLGEFIGQERAIRAIEFGLSMNHDGYNIYVAGLTGTGKTSVVKTYIQKLLEEKQAGDDIKPLADWCYIYNFDDHDRPQIVVLSKGKGKIFREQISILLQKLKDNLTRVFTGEEYKEQKNKMVEESQAEQRKLLDALSEEAQQRGFLFQMTPSGPALIPVVEGKPISQDDYLALDEATRKVIDEKRNETLQKIPGVFEKVRELEKQAVDKMQSTDKQIADNTASMLFNRLLEEYKDSEMIVKYLNDIKQFSLDNLGIFKEAEEPQTTILGVNDGRMMRGGDPFLPFQVNVFVDNSTTEGLPVIVEPHPNYANLFGKIERRFLLGGYLSDHTMLKPGTLHLANGGYLLLSARDVMTNTGVWPALKRAIKTREVHIEDPFEQFGLIAPQGLRAEPMPIDIKIILIGDSELYHLLSMYDEDFWEIFKVKADFNYEFDRTKENMLGFAAFIAGCCENCKLRHFDRTGVAKVVEYASRMVADKEKLSSRFALITELVEESEYWARKSDHELVSAEHVDKAVNERRFRHNLPDERIREMIESGTIMIDVAGSVVGQVNGLSIYQLGDVMFGRPSRITCKTFMGRGGVVNIERESQLSGRIHDKGVLILSGYMGWKYAQENPLALSASLCFEQSYEGVEGDSASSTELYALLSSLSDVPIKQGLAVTGSVNQKGEIQPIGGVNQKIEGFFRVCKARGLDGEQGVMIPKRNLRNLMLQQEVVEAVTEGKFHVYSVDTIDEGIEVLTGVEAGEKRDDGTYNEGTINYLVDKRLRDMAERLRHFYGPDSGKENKKKAKKET